MRTDYSKIKAHCHQYSRLSEQAIDNFLMHFIASNAGLDEKMDLVTRKYWHIIREMPENFFPTACGEYIIGKALMKDGLLNQYIDHRLIRQRPIEELNHLKFQLTHPWRYVFAKIVDRPEDEFFVLRDEILGDEYLVYSPGIEAYCEERHEHSLYFLLMGYNGVCWQTYGLIAPYLSFDIDDVYVYATEVFPNVKDDESFMRSVYQNPFPYFMLLLGQELPIVMSGNSVLRHYVAEQEMTDKDIDTARLREVFRVQYNKGVYQFTLDEWKMNPHFAACYFNEEEEILYRYAMTREGFYAITEKLIEAGLKVDPEEDYSVGLSLVNTMDQILERDFIINPYEELFPEPDESNISEELRDQLNAFLGKLIPFINSGEQPDLEQLASECGLPLEEAEQLYEQMRDRFSR